MPVPIIPGTAPSANSSEPTANRTAIHQPRARGAHHVDPAARAPGGCLRWSRDSQRATMPSGRSRSTKVTKGPPRPSRPARSCTDIGASYLVGPAMRLRIGHALTPGRPCHIG
jgi:hypothetical protein